MKFDKRNYKHWFYLFSTVLCLLLALPFAISLRRGKKTIIFYGHKFNGNLKSFFVYLLKRNADDLSIYYLTMDKMYYQKLMNQIPVLYTGNFEHMIKVLRSHAIISDHGLQALSPIRLLKRIKLIDVWHGIPFKGFDPYDFKNIHCFDQVWVASRSLKRFYVEKFGFNEKRVRVTGYARIDPLITKDYCEIDLLDKYGIKDNYRKIILMAPTWKHEDASRSVFPFDVSAREFITKLSELGKNRKSLIIFRTHLNTKLGEAIALSNIRFIPFNEYPDTEEVLYISDILVTDWSSIAFDYLVLRKPTIFMDVKPPFAKGFTYDATYRYGEVVDSFKSLIESIEKYIISPERFIDKYGRKMDEVFLEVYGDAADGRSSERYYLNLMSLIAT
ncbi:MAG: CDP-glycerol glycerophosphotransferase family protein [Deltaproteobacteria bacterium]|nr:CDP-glycerol glycerophosphotransferase family protein [Deltaproteobacteria bacterium]